MYTFYLFLVSMFGFVLFYGSAAFGIADLLEFGKYTTSWSSAEVIGTLSLALTAGVVWLWHWRQLLSRRDQLDEDARSLLQFQLFFATSILVFGMVAFGRITIQSLVQMAAGANRTGFLLTAAANLGLTAVLWVHHLRKLIAGSKPGAYAAKAKK
jgi:hypothetical protein